MAAKNGFAKTVAENPPEMAASDGFAKMPSISGRFHGSEEPFCENNGGFPFAKPFFAAIKTAPDQTLFRKTVVGRQKRRDHAAFFRKTVLRCQ